MFAQAKVALDVRFSLFVLDWKQPERRELANGQHTVERSYDEWILSTERNDKINKAGPAGGLQETMMSKRSWTKEYTPATPFTAIIRNAN